MFPYACESKSGSCLIRYSNSSAVSPFLWSMNSTKLLVIMTDLYLVILSPPDSQPHPLTAIGAHVFPCPRLGSVCGDGLRMCAELLATARWTLEEEHTVMGDISLASRHPIRSPCLWRSSRTTICRYPLSVPHPGSRGTSCPYLSGRPAWHRNGP